MLGIVVYVFITVIALLSSPCLTSAFSTRFVTENIKEAGKKEAQEKEKITQQTESNENENIVQNPQSMEIKVIPLVTDIFSRAEDLVDMTPLKLATAISAQYLVTSVNNIPLSGKGALDIFNMLQGLMNDINKTTDIIKLTAEFVNISSAYILSSLDQFIKSECDPMIAQHEMGIIREKFLKMITDHVRLAVKELNDKKIQEDITGSDILVSSARHIVGAFQEMTNEVSMFATKQNENCKSSLLNNTSILVDQVSDKQNKIGDEIISKFDPQIKKHQTIKKDKVNIDAGNIEESMSTADLRDVTLEVFPSELSSQGENSINKEIEKETLKVPEVTPQEHYPFTLLFGNNQKNEQNNQLKSSGFDQKHSFFVSDLDQHEAKSAKTIVIPNDKTKPANDLFNVVEFLTNRDLSHEKTPDLPCDERIEPVCGIDVSINRFIIFLNDCKRKNHNSVHGTNYVWFNMDTCVENLLKNQNQISQLAQNDALSPQR